MFTDATDRIEFELNITNLRGVEKIKLSKLIKTSTMII